MRGENANLKGMYLRSNNEVRKLQSVQLSMLTPSFFVALWKWFIKWHNFRKS